LKPLPARRSDDFEETLVNLAKLDIHVIGGALQCRRKT